MKKNRKYTVLIEEIGWIGVLLILLAYGLLSFGVIDSGDFWYHVLNLVGALGIMVDALAVKNYQPVVLNIVWALIALYSIVKVFV